MKVLIIGIDGYIGWPLALYMAQLGHRIYGIDNLWRRRAVERIGACSAIPISSIEQRRKIYRHITGDSLEIEITDVRDHSRLAAVIAHLRPDACIHLGEIPSAPYSMASLHHCLEVMENNVFGTLALLYCLRVHAPGCHLIKLGSMGEYGNPGIRIPEGKVRVRRGDRTAYVRFPRAGWSWYHLSKCHDSANIEFACENWGLRATDIMQGIVCGTRIPDVDISPAADICSRIGPISTRFDYDEIFGTVVNRFCAQAVIGYPLTIYGDGARKRALLTLGDSVRCISLLAENPPGRGEYRIVNQFGALCSLSGIADLIKDCSQRMVPPPDVQVVDDPRAEPPQVYYSVEASLLSQLGYRQSPLRSAISDAVSDLLPFKERVRKHAARINPTIRWR